MCMCIYIIYYGISLTNIYLITCIHTQEYLCWCKYSISRYIVSLTM